MRHRRFKHDRRTHKPGEEWHDELAWQGGNVPDSPPETPGLKHHLADAVHYIDAAKADMAELQAKLAHLYADARDYQPISKSDVALAELIAVRVITALGIAKAAVLAADEIRYEEGYQ